MKEERFPLGSPIVDGDWVAEGGSFGVTEESPAKGVWRAKQRDSRTEEWC